MPILVVFLVLLATTLHGETRQLADDGRDSTWFVAAIDDFDGDGLDDLLWRSDVTGAWAIDHMDGVDVRQTTPQPCGPLLDTSWSIAATGDVTEDGRAEIVWFKPSKTKVFLWDINHLNGANCTVFGIDRPVGAAGITTDWRVMGVGNFDGLGSGDLLWRNLVLGGGQNDVDLLTYDSVTSTVSTQHIANLSSVPLGWNIVGIGPVDTNGQDDVVWQQASGGKVYFHLIQGTGAGLNVFAAPHIPDTGLLASASADFLGGEGDMDVFLTGTANGQRQMWLRQLDVPSTVATGDVIPTARNSRYRGITFKNLDFDFEGTGDFDGDGNTDTLWRDPITDENWIHWTRRFQAVDFQPKTSSTTPLGALWLNAINDPANSFQIREDIRAELRAIKNKTGLRQIKTFFGVGQTFSHPDPLPHELANLTTFLNMLADENMQVTFNLGHHCWLSNDLLEGPNNPTPFNHIGGTPSNGGCFQVNSTITCDANCDPPTGLNPAFCQKVWWDMPRCTINANENYLDDTVDWYKAIASHIEATVPSFRKTVLWFNINGGPDLKVAAEPNVFTPAWWGDPTDPNDGHQQIRTDATAFYTQVFEGLRATSSLRIGMKFLIGGVASEPPLRRYEAVSHFADAMPAVVADLDFFDLTSAFYTDVDEVIQRLDLPPERADIFAVTDFKSSCYELGEGNCPTGAPTNMPLEEIVSCFLNYVEDRGLLGYWFETYRQVNNDSGIQTVSGLREAGAPTGDDPLGLNTWEDATIDVMQKDLGIVGAPAWPACRFVLPLMTVPSP